MSATKRRFLGLVLGLAVLIPSWMAVRAESPKPPGFLVQVFALVGPTCPLRFGQRCPDAFLPDTRLMLERRNGQGDFELVQEFWTNPLGYAFLEVERRGFYRIIALQRVGPGGEPPFPRLASPVTFKVPASQFDASGEPLTPVAVFFDSGIR